MISPELKKTYKKFIKDVVTKSNTGWDNYYIRKTKEGKFILYKYFHTLDSGGYEIERTYSNEFETITNLKRFIKLGRVDIY